MTETQKIQIATNMLRAGCTKAQVAAETRLRAFARFAGKLLALKASS